MQERKTLSDIIEVEHKKVEEGRQRLAEKLASGIEVPKWSPRLLEGRWRALKLGVEKLDADEDKMIKASMEIIASQTMVGDQRDVYYSIRGSHPEWTYHNKPLKSKEVYNAYTSSIMEKIQTATNLTMQSFGVRAGPRGYITGDGQIYIPRKKINVRLNAMPALTFDLCDEGTEFYSNARKVIHFEKAAGFERLVSGDIVQMIEAMFSTSQGYLVEAANKLLADMERRGLRIYAVHDGDPHGLQMQLMYGLASKSNAYMPTAFYPQKVNILGFYPRVGKALNLPAEEVGEEHKRIIPNLEKIIEEHPAFKPDLDIIKEGSQWEFQALNAIDEVAAQIYLVEALRVKGDEIKYVPSAEKIKEEMLENIREIFSGFIDRKIEQFVDNWFSAKLRSRLITRLKELLAEDISEWNEKASQEYEKLEDMDAEDLREAIKLGLCRDPTKYWDNVFSSVRNSMVHTSFDILAEPEIEVVLKEAKVDKEVEVDAPELPDKPLTKDNIVESIEKRIIGRAEKRGKIVGRIRAALELLFGKPEQRW